MKKNFTDQEIIDGLLQKTAARTEEIVSQLYRDCQKSIDWMVMSNSGTKEQANDLFQEVILVFLNNVWNNKFELRPNSRVKTYIYEVARMMWLKQLRNDANRLNREKTYLEENQPNAISDQNPEQDFLNAEEVEQALTVFHRLDAFCQQILTAFYSERMTMQQIADSFNLGTAANAKTRKYRCMESLKKILKP